MSKILVLSSIAMLSSCASMQLKQYSGTLQKEFIEDIILKKDVAFTATEVHLAKWLVNSNYFFPVF